MRIHRLDVEGFRSLKKVSWEPGALNVVIGPNGSGKSNLLKVFSLLSDASHQQLAKHIMRSGGVDQLLWDGQAIDFHIFTHFTDPDNSSMELSYHININNNYDKNKLLNVLEVFISGDHHSVRDDTDTITEYFQSQATETYPYKINSRESLLGFLPQSYPFYGDYLSMINFIQESLIYNYFDSNPKSVVRSPVITSYENYLYTDGSNLIQVLHTLYTSDRNFESDVDCAMSAAFGNDYEKLVFPPAADQRVQLRIRWKSLKREQSALDISDGTLRFLYLLAILANPEPAPLIAIDEPETGLHPSMFPIIAEFAQECSRKSQVIFTTHSPQFLDAFGGSPPTTTVAQWHEGETLLKVLDGDRLAKWLKHYSMGHMFMSGELEAFD